MSPTCGYGSEQYGLQPGATVLADVWCYYVSSLLSLVRVTALWSKLIQAADTDWSWKSVTCRCRMQGRDNRSSYDMAGTQINPDDLSLVQRCPLSHLPVAPVWSSCLPPARVTLVVVPWRVLWNQSDDLEFYPLTPVWEVNLWRGCTHMIGLFLFFPKTPPNHLWARKTCIISTANTIKPALFTTINISVITREIFHFTHQGKTLLYHISGHTLQTGFTISAYSPTLNGRNVSHSSHKANREHIIWKHGGLWAKGYFTYIKSLFTAP